MEIANKIGPNPDTQMVWAGVFRKASLQSLLGQVPLFLGGSRRSHWLSHWNTIVFYSLWDQMSLSINTVFVLWLKGKVAFPVVLFWNLKDCFLSVIANVGDSQAPEFGMASLVVMRTRNMVWAEFRLNWPRKGILFGCSPQGCFAVSTENKFWRSNANVWPHPCNKSARHDFSHKVRQARACAEGRWKNEMVQNSRQISFWSIARFRNVLSFIESVSQVGNKEEDFAITEDLFVCTHTLMQPTVCVWTCAIACVCVFNRLRQKDLVGLSVAIHLTMNWRSQTSPDSPQGCSVLSTPCFRSGFHSEQTLCSLPRASKANVSRHCLASPPYRNSGPFSSLVFFPLFLVFSLWGRFCLASKTPKGSPPKFKFWEGVSQ